MRYIVDRKQMQEIDAYSIQKIGIPGLVLMERAALAMESICKERFAQDKKILIITERGNNGGDGLVLGRLLIEDGYAVDVFEIGGVARASESYEAQLHIYKELGIPILRQMPEKEYDVYVDAIFGVGLTRAVAGIQKEIIDLVNEKAGFKLAVDLPSGVDATDGSVLGTAFRADLTITFGFQKAGLVLYPGANYAGEIIVAKIGFPQKAVDAIGPKGFTFGEEDLALLPKRRSDSHKGSYGKVLLIAGSKNMSGAAYLSAKAAYKMGSGLVRIFTCEENRTILQTLLPEAIMTTYSNEEECLELLPEALSWASVVAMGPGIGKSFYMKVVLDHILDHCELPLVLDADGINLLAEKEDALEAFYGYKGSVILTPHLMELSRVLKLPLAQIKTSILDIARNYGKENHVLVLKDARTVVSDGDERFYINTSGNHGMSVGGSGDVLTGIIAGLFAGGLKAMDAACLGVYLHGLAGDYAAKEKGFYGLLAGDIAEYLRCVIH